MKKKNYKIQYEQDDKTKNFHLILEGHLGYDNITAIKEELLSIGLRCGKTLIQINNVNTFDISSIQLILSIKKTLENQDASSEVEIETLLNEEHKLLIRNSGFNEIINANN